MTTEDKVKNQDMLEERIRDCWNVVGDIHVLNEAYQDRGMTVDEVANVLLGLESLYKLKFERLYLHFEKMKEKEQNKP
jgi:hypothetical protein